MLMGVKEIQEIIPHRHPFLLVDLSLIHISEPTRH